MSKDDKFLDEIKEIIEDKIVAYIYKFNQEPKYIKMPLGLVVYLKEEMQKIVNFKIDYIDGLIKYRGLIVCETISIEKIEDIEVF